MNNLLSAAGSGSAVVSNLGGILQGIAELLLALGAGIGFVVRTRRNAKREKLRAETAASLAAAETKKTLEERLAKEQQERQNQYQTQLSTQETAHTSQIEQLQSQIRDLQTMNTHLLDRFLGEGHHE